MSGVILALDQGTTASTATVEADPGCGACHRPNQHQPDVALQHPQSNGGRRADPCVRRVGAEAPPIKPSCGIFGEAATSDDLLVGIPIAGVVGDQQAALYGQSCWDQGTAKATYGTGAFVLMQLGKRHPIMDHGLLTTICCDARGQAAYALEGTILTAGAAIQWLRDELRFIDRAADTEALAAGVSDTAGVYFVPAFTGLGVPYWDMRARGAILGPTRGTSRRHLARAVLESLAF